MNISRCARVCSVAMMFPLLGLAAGCNPGSLLGSGGDSGKSQYVPDPTIPPPAHSAALPCGDPDASHLCVAVNYVAYLNSSNQPVVPKSLATQVVSNVNSLWAQCHIQFYLDNYQAVDPSARGLAYQPSSMSELADIRSTFANPTQLSVIDTGQWTGDLGAQATNAWTELPPVGPFGVVVEAAAAPVANLIAHELGHYLNLEHVADVYDVMNPVIYGNSINLTDKQCGEARATAISFWGQALR